MPYDLRLLVTALRLLQWLYHAKKRKKITPFSRLSASNMHLYTMELYQTVMLLLSMFLITLLHSGKVVLKHNSSLSSPVSGSMLHTFINSARLSCISTFHWPDKVFSLAVLQ